MYCPESKIDFSPSRKYRIEQTPVETKPGCWSYVEAYITNMQNMKVVATTKRNYSHLFYQFIEDYLGTDWLLISENYHGGYGVIDLQTEQKYVFDPEVAPWYLGGTKGWKIGKFIERKLPLPYRFSSRLARKFGWGENWCWVQVNNFDREKKTIEVEGCYWAWPYEIITFDFSDPRKLPYKQLDCRPAPYEEEEPDDEEPEEEQPVVDQPSAM